MESIPVKEVSFVPVTPEKALNCSVNCAITSVSNSGITSATIRYDSGEYIDSVATRLIAGDVLLNESVVSTRLSMTTDAGFEAPFSSQPLNQSAAIPHAENKDDEVILPQQKNKKRKVGPDLNKKPGEKRQNKYYWSKIDDSMPQTLAPRTPKVVTQKPPKSKTPKPAKPKTPKVGTPKSRRKNDKRKPIECLHTYEHVEGEPVIHSVCKRSLNFGAVVTTDLEADNVPKVVESGFEKITKDTICTQGKGINVGDGAMIKVKPNIKPKEKTLLVYRRKINSKCLYICRNLVPKFEENFKRKRLRRNKKSFRGLKRFEGFNHTCLVGGLLDRVLSVKGKRRMLLPTKVDFPKDVDKFNCVLSLLSSRPAFTMKKRLPRTRCSTKVPIHQGETVLSSATRETREPLKDEITSAGKPCNNSDVDLIMSTPSSSKSSSKPLSEGHRGRKPAAIKEKKSKRNYKRKGKQYDFLDKLSDWDDASVEEIMDKFLPLFRSLELNDNPNTWIIEICDQGNKTDYEKIRLKEERANLFNKIGKFLQEMSYYQGSKKFFKWNGSVLDSIVGVFLTQNVSDFLSSNAFLSLASKYPIKPPTNSDTGVDHMGSEGTSSQGSCETVSSSQKVIVEHPDDEEETTPDPNGEETWPIGSKEREESDAALREMFASMPYLQESKKQGKKTEGPNIDWEKIRLRFFKKGPRKSGNEDSVDWEAVRKAKHAEVAEVIRPRGQHNIIAAKIQKSLNRLVDHHGSLDVEWLRDAPPQVAKAYLLSFYGLGLKSVECLRLLTLHHHGFPVDVNISRIAIRLGWVPIKPLPPGMPFHLLQKYPLEDAIQQYLWPRLCDLSQKMLYHLHYQMITCGKVFCQKRSPNCRACPFKSDCRYYASLSESSRQALPGPTDRKTKKSKKQQNIPNPFDRVIRRLFGSLPSVTSNTTSCSEIRGSSLEVASSLQLANTIGNVSQDPIYFVEVPLSPKSAVEEEEEEGRVGNEEQINLIDIEDCCDEDMYHLKLNSKENKRASSNYYQESNISSQNSASREMIIVSENIFNPLPKQVNVARLRTEHQVYELPHDHALLIQLNLEIQLGNVPYLLATWTTPDQSEKASENTEGGPCSSEGQRTSQDDDSQRTSQDDDSTIPGTLLLPVQTALKRCFPLNGTYFQMNEVFVDYETCERPVNVPTASIWNLNRRTVYCGSGTSAIVKGRTETDIRQCFREGFICTRAFNRKTRGPETLPSKFHSRPKGKAQPENEDED